VADQVNLSAFGLEYGAIMIANSGGSRILAPEEEHANDMHDLLVTHEGRPMLEK